MDTDAQTSGQRPRTWLLALLGLALIGLVAYRMWPTAPGPASVAQQSSNPSVGGKPVETIDPAELNVRLDALKDKRPDPGDLERNPFRFKPPPAPPPPPPQKLTPPVDPTPLPPPAPVIPPIPLKFMGTVERGNLKLAALTDCKGYTYSGREGELIDGRYKLVRIGQESVVMEYANGTGRITIRKTGECPK